MSKSYAAPKVTTLGTVAQLTAMPNNKIGSASDQFSTVQNDLVGSVVPAQ
jgi:hypothetical protein